MPHCVLYWKSQIEDGSFTEKDCLLIKRVKRDALLTNSKLDARERIPTADSPTLNKVIADNQEGEVGDQFRGKGCHVWRGRLFHKREN